MVLCPIAHLIMNEIVYNHDLAYTHYNRDYILCRIQDHAFDGIRDSERFRAYAEKVKAMEGLEFSFGSIDFND